MTGKGEKRFRFLKALLVCLVLATAINGIPKLLTTNAPVGDVMTSIGISAIGYWLIYLMFVGVAAAVRKLKGTDIGASDAASETASDAASDAASDEVSENLSGWQRLWVVLSAMWLAFLALLVFVRGRGEFGEAVLIWAITSVGLYLLGLGVAWVWQGFKSKGESNDE